MKQFILVTSLYIFSFSLHSQEGRWSEEKANNWYKQFTWLNGINYIPSNAINYTEMWDKTSFSADVIEKELALAQSIGFNCVRVVLQYAVYEDDSEYFVRTLDKFLSICDKYGMKVMPSFFDDCAFGVNTDPTVGKQPEAIEGWYSWAWSPSPGHTKVVDEREHPKLEEYVKNIMTHFKNDKRIFVWDLYNEPNTPHGKYNIPLVKKVFSWAREVSPDQPVTIGVWWPDLEELNEIIYANSDIITFHFYETREKTEARIKELKAQFNRPIICTEWMNRTAKSYVVEIMPLFKENNVGSMLWGLVNGKTQTHLSWGHRPEHLPYEGEWQHDLFHGDFTPYNQTEIEFIKELNGVK